MDREILDIAEKFLKPPHLKRFLYSFEGGKRVRPLLIKKICEKYGKDFQSLIKESAAVEMLHCSSLIHDDIIDKEGERRGKKPLYKEFSLEEALLLGDLIAMTSVEIFLESNASLREEFFHAVREMIEGQLMESMGEVKDISSYMKYIEKKTASLFVLCAKIPLHTFKLGNGILEFSREFGLAFQISNDLKNKGKEKFSILNFLPREEAESLLREKKDRLKKMDILDPEELGL
jgi:geranylgeranyl pyrophosphate synthase